MVIWIDGTPDFNTPSGIERIDLVMSCNIPYDDQDLKNLIKNCQTHRHTATCTKNTTNCCRFNFPRQLSERTTVTSSSSDAFIRNGGIRKEKTDLSKKMYKICMKILNCRQVSSCECIYRLCHLPMKHSSRSTVFINTRRPELLYRVLKFTRFNEASGFCNNLFDRYEKRHDYHSDFNFETMTVCEFAMLFEAYYKKTQVFDDDENGDEEIHRDISSSKIKNKLITLKDNTKMRARNQPAVLSFPHFNLSKDRENYYYSMLVQHIPFRNEKDLLVNHLSAEAAFLHNEPTLRDNNTRMELYRQRDQELENAFNQLNAFQQLEEYVPTENEQHEEELPCPTAMSNEEFTNARKK